MMRELFHQSHSPLSAAPWRAASLLALCLFAGGCGEETNDVAPSNLPPPQPPGKADNAYSVQGARSWYLVGNGLAPGDDRLELTATVPDGTRFIDTWIDGRYAGRVRVEDRSLNLDVDIGSLEAGQHEALFSADGASEAFSQIVFFRSHPLYVVVSNDWDDPDNPDETLDRQQRLHDRHPRMKLTHFVGPYTFTDPSVSADRAARLAGWAREMRDGYGDEIGLHIHPYCSFVSTTGVTCRTSPSFAYANGDETGYTVFLSSYTEEEMLQLLVKADEIFQASGLGKPVSFRAGGWTARIHTLTALSKSGFLAESSGCNWSRLEEWEGYPGADLYEWNKENWSTINETSQPYYPSENDILSTNQPAVPILEVPDNGLLVDYVTAAEMIEMLHANWQEGVLGRPIAYVIGYHPPNFSESYFDRMDETLEHIDRFLHSSDGGPIVYVNVSDLALVWPPPVAGPGPD